MAFTVKWKLVKKRSLLHLEFLGSQFLTKNANYFGRFWKFMLKFCFPDIMQLQWQRVGVISIDMEKKNLGRFQINIQYPIEEYNYFLFWASRPLPKKGGGQGKSKVKLFAF